MSALSTLRSQLSSFAGPGKRKRSGVSREDRAVRKRMRAGALAARGEVEVRARRRGEGAEKLSSKRAGTKRPRRRLALLRRNAALGKLSETAEKQRSLLSRVTGRDK